MQTNRIPIRFFRRDWRRTKARWTVQRRHARGAARFRGFAGSATCRHRCLLKIVGEQSRAECQEPQRGLQYRASVMKKPSLTERPFHILRCGWQPAHGAGPGHRCSHPTRSLIGRKRDMRRKGSNINPPTGRFLMDMAFRRCASVIQDVCSRAINSMRWRGVAPWCSGPARVVGPNGPKLRIWSSRRTERAL